MNVLPTITHFLKSMRIIQSRCVACHSLFTSEPKAIPQLTLCPECMATIPQKLAGFCSLCGDIFPNPTLAPCLCSRCLQERPPWQALHFYGEYKTLLRDLILQTKQNLYPAATKILGTLLIQTITSYYSAQLQTQKKLPFDYCIPIPLHPKRLFQRGANQCTLLAKEFCSHFSLPIQQTILIRSQATPKQRGLTRKERQQNLVHAFALTPPAQLENKHILLLDDVITTGSTLTQACLTLQKAHVASITCLAVARVPINW